MAGSATLHLLRAVDPKALSLNYNNKTMICMFSIFELDSLLNQVLKVFDGNVARFILLSRPMIFNRLF